jgi:hypothetical protein
MWPLYPEGSLLHWEMAKLSELSPGDIVLLSLKKNLRVHRFIALTEEGKLRCIGDGLWREDTAISPEALMGRIKKPETLFQKILDCFLRKITLWRAGKSG